MQRCAPAATWSICCVSSPLCSAGRSTSSTPAPSAGARSPTQLADAGEWVDALDPVVPDWLHPFGGRVLVARGDDGRYLAGVGIKRHDGYGHELSVGTEPEARGRGLARRLVAQAARALLDDGIVATYLHDPANEASARVAEATGFLDLGWRVLGMFDPSEAGAA